MKTALITGATGGLGECWAKKLAQEGYNLIITGRNSKKLNLIKEDLISKYAIKVDCIVADLSLAEDLNNLLNMIESRSDIYFFVMAAGFAVPTPFDADNLSRQMDQVDVQVIATTNITHAVLKQMNVRNEGTIILVSSTMAYYSVPGNAIHCACKSFINTFAESLAAEMIYTNIKVQALTPGLMHTGFHSTSDFAEIGNASFGPDFMFMAPEKVVDYSYKKLNSHEVIVIPGFGNRRSVKMKKLMSYIFKKKVMGDNMGRPIPPKSSYNR